MCVICIKPAGAALPGIETFRSAHDSNPHGAGFMVADPGGEKVIVHKGFFDPGDMYEFVVQLAARLGAPPEDLNMVIHWRYATHGSRTPGNCHPFPLTADVEALKSPSIEWNGPAMAHNGVFPIEVPRDERDLSDTQAAIMKVFSEMTFDDIDGAADRDIPILGSNRIVVLDPSGRITHKGSWLEDSGCWWSNGTYRRFTRSHDRQQETDDCPSFLEDEEPQWDDENYVQNGGGYCPACYCTDIGVGGFIEDCQPGVIVRNCICNQCKVTWQEEYCLVDASRTAAESNEEEEIMPEKEAVFVYGTLKKGGHFSRALEGQEFLGAAETAVPRPLYLGTYPYVLKDKGKVPVKGEVYKVDAPCLRHLDSIEGHPGLYTREKEEVVFPDGKRVTAWMYFFPLENERMIKPSVFIPDGVFPLDREDQANIKQGLVYTVSGVKTFRGINCKGYSATLRRNGSRIARITDRANGNNLEIEWFAVSERDKFFQFLRRNKLTSRDGRLKKHAARIYTGELVSHALTKRRSITSLTLA